MSTPRYTVLEAIATGNPPVAGAQTEAAAFMQRVTSLPTRIRERIPLIYERSAIDQRYTTIGDYKESDVEQFTFFPPTWSLSPAPTTGQRNRRYKDYIVPLATEVGRAALQRAGRTPDEVTHVIAVSCTGFFAPGLDIALVKHLGLSPTTQRTLIGFMGCYAAFNGLRVAHSFCQAHPNACVLLVCAELCTLHFQIDDTLESAIVNALFSDGAAAAVLTAKEHADALGHLAYTDAHTLLDEDSLNYMTWAIGDTGFEMGLSARVPQVIARHLPGFVDTLLDRNGLSKDDLDFWAIHPGGRAIVEKAQRVLGLSNADVHASLEILRRYGNMSSPTILFVLNSLLEQHSQAQKVGESGFKSGVAMAFGPGLTLEGCLWQMV